MDCDVEQETFEPLLNKVAIESKGSNNAHASHNLETGAIHQAKLSSPSHQQGRHRCQMSWLVHPPYPNDRKNVYLERPNRLKTEPALGNRAYLDNNIVGSDQ